MKNDDSSSYPRNPVLCIVNARKTYNDHKEEQDMTETQTLKTLQLFYAGLLVDAVRQYQKFGILEQVIEKKKQEQKLAAPDQLSRLGIGNVEELFTTFSTIFGCASWRIDTIGTDIGPGYKATASSCLACAIAKKLGAPSPCAISCINPFTALAKALPVSRTLVAEQTLWDSDSCVFVLNQA
jgi:hypothetical protein